MPLTEWEQGKHCLPTTNFPWLSTYIVITDSGYALIGSLIFLSAFPPMIGYGTYQTLSGFTFGFLRGFPLSYFGALAGSLTCFYLSRRFLKNRVLRLVAKYPKLEAVVHAVEKKGFRVSFH
jgi:uncharacterized membrane protein YdjX (TVP38/TMEM64 family)